MKERLEVRKRNYRTVNLIEIKLLTKYNFKTEISDSIELNKTNFQKEFVDVCVTCDISMFSLHIINFYQLRINFL